MTNAQCFTRYPQVSPGHSRTLHLPSSSAGPNTSQSEPPCSGTGLVHVRVRVFFPIPHDVEHAPHSDHNEYPPCTRIETNA